MSSYVHHCSMCEQEIEGDDEQFIGATGFKRRVCIECFFRFIEKTPPRKAGEGTDTQTS